MAILPIRGLGEVGVIKDIDPFDLPPNAFSSGVNVRFANGVMQRGPVFRTVLDLDTGGAFVDSLTPLTGLDYIILGQSNGTIRRVTGFTSEDITPSTWTPSESPIQWTSTNLSDVYYTNREDRVPWYMPRGGTQMANIPGWGTDWRCKSLRSFNSQLIALGMTEGAYEYPTTLRWSDFALSGAPPSSWTPSTTNSAGRTTLGEMVNPIIDGFQLRSSFIIYSRDEVWAMEPSQDNNVFNFRRLFSNAGVINKNCAVEFEGKHYVFGFDDIYVHDGVQKQSIADGRVRQYIFRTMNKRFSLRFFVVHNRALNEIMFCYVSGDENAYWPASGEGCNRAAVYNYVADTWSFADLPMSLAGSIANLNTSLTWTQASNSWNLTGGSWLDKDDGYKRNVMFAGVGVVAPNGTLTPKLHVYEPFDTGTTSAPVDTVATTRCFVRRDGIDLDEIKAELRGYKQIVSVYPEGRVRVGGQPLYFQFGSATVPDETPLLGDAMDYDGTTNYKLDYRDAGRFLSMQISYNDYRSFTLSGLDVDVVITGSR